MVSVVLPTLNRPEYLTQALTSALAQTYPNFEILIRDNASEPGTAAAVEKFQDARIRYVRHPVNVGMTANVLGAFREAKGKYVTNLHDDDFWEPTFLEKMIAVLESNEQAVIAFSDHYIVDAGSEIQEKATEDSTNNFGRSLPSAGLRQPFKELALIKLSVPMAMATVLRREAIDWNDFPDLTCAYDFWLVYLACRGGGACYYLPERLTSYRVHAASESVLGRIRLNKGFIEIYEGMLKDDRVEEFHHIFKERTAVHYTEAAVAMLRNGERENARKMLLDGMNYRSTLKSCFVYAASYIPGIISSRFPAKMRFPYENTSYRH